MQMSVVLGALSLATSPLSVDVKLGPWHASLASAGGELPFDLGIERVDGVLHAFLINGSERIAVPAMLVEGDEIVFDIDHYDSTIHTTLTTDGTRLDGEWRKVSGAERITRMPFTAVAGAAPRFVALGGTASRAHELDGRWLARFAKSEDPAVAVFRATGGGSVEGTFLTTTGDYRYLAGSLDGDRLRLSCFDGAHAFLFDARFKDDGTLAGDFWSGDKWHETWTAVRDEKAALADAFGAVRAQQDFGLALLSFADLDGELVSLADARFDGKARIIQVLGSWCPNCHDETAYLADLDRRYRAKGLSIVGLAFEYANDFERDAAQVKKMRARHGAEYPMLLAGNADKKKAAQALPALDRVLAFPTTIFLHADGRVRAVHSGFAGPGTDEEHLRLRAEFERLIDELLTEPTPSDDVAWLALKSRTWCRASDQDSQSPRTFTFHEGSDGRREVHVDTPPGRVEMQRPSSNQAVTVMGTTVRIADRVLYLDREFGPYLIEPPDFVSPFRGPASGCTMPAPIPVEQVITDELSSEVAGRRRQGVYMLIDHLRARGSKDLTQFRDKLRFTDPDPVVAAMSVWLLGQLDRERAVPQLIAALDGGSPMVRREAARALADISTPTSHGALQSLVRDCDPVVRALAIATVRAKAGR